MNKQPSNLPERHYEITVRQTLIIIVIALILDFLFSTGTFLSNDGAIFIIKGFILFFSIYVAYVSGYQGCKNYISKTMDSQLKEKGFPDEFVNMFGELEEDKAAKILTKNLIKQTKKIKFNKSA